MASLGKIFWQVDHRFLRLWKLMALGFRVQLYWKRFSGDSRLSPVFKLFFFMFHEIGFLRKQLITVHKVVVLLGFCIHEHWWGV